MADAIDLAGISRLVASTAPVHMAPKPQTPPYVQYTNPPISIDGAAAGMPQVAGFRVRFRLFDYGVTSVALTRPMPSAWDRLVAEGLGLHDDAGIASGAERQCRAFVDRLGPAMVRPRTEFLSEDYLVFAVTGADGTPADHFWRRTARRSPSSFAASGNH